MWRGPWKTIGSSLQCQRRNISTVQHHVHRSLRRSIDLSRETNFYVLMFGSMYSGNEKKTPNSAIAVSVWFASEAIGN